MIMGAHFLLYSREADADRQLPARRRRPQRRGRGRRMADPGAAPAEIAVHPATQSFVQRDAGHEMFGAVMYLCPTT